MGAVAVITAPGEDLSDEDLAALVDFERAADGGRDGAAAPRAAREARGGQRATQSGRVNASPAARKRAGELGIDLATVEATGPGGRVTSDDVERAAAELRPQPRPREEPRWSSWRTARTIYALVAGPGDATETIVFLHGLGGSQSTWASVLGDFAEHVPRRRDRPSRPRRERQARVRSAFDYCGSRAGRGGRRG